MEWVDATSSEYWTATYGTYSGGTWSSGDFGGYQFVALTPGSWATGYNKGKIRVTYSLSSLTLIAMGTLSSAMEVVNSGTEVDIGSIGDLTFFQFGGTETPFTVSKIEIYGDSLEEEEDVPAVVVTLGTSKSWSERVRPGRTRGVKHRPLKTKTR